MVNDIELNTNEQEYNASKAWDEYLLASFDEYGYIFDPEFIDLMMFVRTYIDVDIATNFVLCTSSYVDANDAVDYCEVLTQEEKKSMKGYLLDHFTNRFVGLVTITAIMEEPLTNAQYSIGRVLLRKLREAIGHDYNLTMSNVSDMFMWFAENEECRK